MARRSAGLRSRVRGTTFSCELLVEPGPFVRGNPLPSGYLRFLVHWPHGRPCNQLRRCDDRPHSCSFPPRKSYRTSISSSRLAQATSATETAHQSPDRLGIIRPDGTIVAPQPDRPSSMTLKPASGELGEPCAGEPNGRFVAAGRRPGQPSRAIQAPSRRPYPRPYERSQFLLADAGPRSPVCLRVAAPSIEFMPARRAGGAGEASASPSSWIRLGWDRPTDAPE
jgi:hypothetical protein